MKKIILLFVVLIASLTIYGQDRVFSVEELTRFGLSMQQLDSIYKNSLPASDSINPLFDQGYFDTVVEPARLLLLQQAGGYLSKNDFRWGEPVKLWNRIYVNADGSIDYFVYHLMSSIDPKQELELKKQLNAFLKGEKLPVKSSKKWSLCGGVVWKD